MRPLSGYSPAHYSAKPELFAGNNSATIWKLQSNICLVILNVWANACTTGQRFSDIMMRGIANASVSCISDSREWPGTRPCDEESCNLAQAQNLGARGQTTDAGATIGRRFRRTTTPAIRFVNACESSDFALLLGRKRGSGVRSTRGRPPCRSSSCLREARAATTSRSGYSERGY